MSKIMKPVFEILSMVMVMVMVMVMMAIMVTVMAGKPVYQAWLPLRSGRQSWNREAPTKKQHIELLSLPCLLRCLERQINFHKLQQIQQKWKKRIKLLSLLWFLRYLKRKTCLFQTKTKKKAVCFKQRQKKKLFLWCWSLIQLGDYAGWDSIFFQLTKKFQLTKHFFNSPNIFVTHQTFL